MCVCGIRGSLVGSPQSKGHKKKEEAPAQKEMGQQQKLEQRGAGMHDYPSPPPSLRETQKTGDLFIFNCFYFSILQIHIECKENHRGWWEQGAAGRPGAQRGHLS